MQATKEQIQQEALGRAIGGQSMTNWPAIIRGFMAKGIPENEIRPRENCLTYNAWPPSPPRGTRGQSADVPSGARP
jgi:hypothetical protein